MVEKGHFKVMEQIPEGRRAIGTKWLCGWKIDEDGLSTEHTARFVWWRKLQQPGVDFDDTFGPTPPGLTPRVLVVNARHNNLTMYHLGVEQAFTQSPLEEIYLRLAKGCGDYSGRYVRVLRASICSSKKQVGRETPNL